jgi:hypothetical protein
MWHLVLIPNQPVDHGPTWQREAAMPGRPGVGVAVVHDRDYHPHHESGWYVDILPPVAAAGVEAALRGLGVSRRHARLMARAARGRTGGR